MKNFLLNSILLSVLMSISTIARDCIIRNPLPTAASMQKIEWKVGTHNLSLQQTDGSSWNYQLNIPELKEGDKVPLIIALHWAGSATTYQM